VKDYTKAELEVGRPPESSLRLAEFCLERLYSDHEHSLDDLVVNGLTFEELIGALLKLRDSSHLHIEDVMWPEPIPAPQPSDMKEPPDVGGYVPRHALLELRVSSRGVYADPNFARAGDLFQHIPKSLEDGRHDLLVQSIEAKGSSWKLLLVREEDKAEALVTLGAPGKSRDRRLRTLVGRADVEELEELRALLVGQHVNLRVSTYEVAGREYRGIDR
jgi:hypothetical protein